MPAHQQGHQIGAFTGFSHITNPREGSGGDSDSEDDGKKGGKRKRQMKSPEQLAVLEREFAISPLPNKETRYRISNLISLTPRQVQIWFQNKRAKVKNAHRNRDPNFSFQPQVPSGDLEKDSPKRRKEEAHQEVVPHTDPYHPYAQQFGQAPSHPRGHLQVHPHPLQYFTPQGYAYPAGTVIPQQQPSFHQQDEQKPGPGTFSNDHKPEAEPTQPTTEEARKADEGTEKAEQTEGGAQKDQNLDEKEQNGGGKVEGEDEEQDGGGRRRREQKQNIENKRSQTKQRKTPPRQKSQAKQEQKAKALMFNVWPSINKHVVAGNPLSSLSPLCKSLQKTDPRASSQDTIVGSWRAQALNSS